MLVLVLSVCAVCVFVRVGRALATVYGTPSWKRSGSGSTIRGRMGWLFLPPITVLLTSCFMSDTSLLSTNASPASYPIAATRFFATSTGDKPQRVFVEKTATGYQVSDNVGTPAWETLRFTPFPDSPHSGFIKNRYIMEASSVSNAGKSTSFAYFLVYFPVGTSMTVLTPGERGPLDVCKTLTADQKAALHIESSLLGCSFTSLDQLKAAFADLDAAPGYGLGLSYSIEPLASTDAPPPKPFNTCDDPTSLVSLAALKAVVRRDSPARYTRQIDNSAFEYDESAAHFGPYSEALDGRPGHYRVAFPAQFLKNQCKISFLELITHWAPRPSATQPATGSWEESFESRFKACAVSAEVAARCFGQSLDAVMAENKSLLDTIASDDMETGKLIFAEAIRRLTLHEIGHIVLGHDDRNDILPRDELDADTFALFFGSASGAMPRTNSDIFSPYTVLDSYPGKDFDLHGSFFCRFMIGWFIERDIGTTPIEIIQATQARGLVSKEMREAFRHDLAAADKTLPSGMDLHPFSLTCPVVTNPQYKTVGHDIGLLARLIRASFPAIDAVDGGADPAPLVRQVLALPLKSAEGRSLAYSVAVGLIGVSSTHWKIEQWRDFAAHGLIDEMMAKDGHLDMPAQSYGELLATRAQSLYYAAPDDAPPALAAALANIQGALFYDSGNMNMLLLSGLLKIQTGDCAGGIKDYGNGVHLAQRVGQSSPVVEQMLELLPQAEAKLGCARLGELVPYLTSRKKGPPQAP